MFTPMLFAIVSLTLPTSDSATSLHSPEPLKVTIGHMTFLGDSVKLTKLSNETFKCSIDGDARFTFGSNGDINTTITAQKLLITSNNDTDVYIQCTGNCKCADSEYTCSADSMMIQLGKQVILKLSGNVTVESDGDDKRTSLAGESITIHEGNFRVSGTALLERHE